MTEIQDPPIPRRHDARLLLEDLACLTALQDTARQLAADIATAGAGVSAGSAPARGVHRHQGG